MFLTRSWWYDRDKYMFHQANVIPSSDLPGSPSLLAYWYQEVMAELTSLLAFPVMVRALYSNGHVFNVLYLLSTNICST